MSQDSEQPPINFDAKVPAAESGRNERFNDHDTEVLANATVVEWALGDLWPSLMTDHPPGTYPERERILESCIGKVAAMRSAMTQVANETGLEVTEDQRLNWMPEDAELQRLINWLRPERVRLQMMNGLVNYLERHGNDGRLRPHQVEALVATKEFLERAPTTSSGGGKAGYLDMPTGSGKTATFVTLANALKSQESSSDPLRILVIAPTIPIQRQTVGLADKPGDRKGFAKFARNLRVSTYNGREKELDNVTVITNASFNQLVAAGKMPDYDVVMFDEVHTGLGSDISENLTRYSQGKVVIGFTATPDYHDEKTTASLLQHRIYELSLPNAIERGILAPVRAELRNIVLNIDTSSLPDDQAERSAAIRRAYFDARLEDALSDIKQAVREGKKVLVRCPPGGNIWFAKRAAEVLQEEEIATQDREYLGKIKAVAIGGNDQPTKDQEILLTAFNNGAVHVLTYVNLLNMGVDIPDAALFVDLYPTSSRVSKVQGIGRVLRLKYDKHGKPIMARVIDYLDPNNKSRYTAADVLNLKPGQVTYRDSQRSVRIGANGGIAYDKIDLVDSEVTAAGTVDTVIIEHDNNIQPASVAVVPDESDERVVDPSIPESLEFNKAADWFGITPKKLTKYLNDLGHEIEGRIDAQLIVQLMEHYPNLRIDTLPEQGFTEISEVIRLMGSEKTPAGFVKFMSEEGIVVYRFRRQDGTVGLYLSNKNFKPSPWVKT